MHENVNSRKRVLIISRHYPSYSQIKLVQKECGADCLITWENQRFRDAEEILDWYNEGDYNDLALVAPKEILVQLVLKNGLKPIHLSTVEIDEGEQGPGDFKKEKVWLRCTAKRIKWVDISIDYY